MAIANGDTVIVNIGSGSAYAAPTKVLRGMISGITAGAGDVLWENGIFVLDVPVTSLQKIDPAGAPANVRAFLLNKFMRVPGQPQEASGIFIDAYVAEEDGGDREGHIVVLLTGRGDGGFPVFLDFNFGDDVFTGFETFFRTFGPDDHERY